ncbi:MAG: flexitail domain-containing putative surface protein [Solirubrobacterales bacterium]
MHRRPGVRAPAGGWRNPVSLWDFMDVPTGTALGRDRAVAGSDIAGVVKRFGSNDSGPGSFNRSSDPLSRPNPAVVPPGTRSNYHPAYDRGGAQPENPLLLGPPDGATSGGDISAAVFQFGDNCL